MPRRSDKIVQQFKRALRRELWMTAGPAALAIVAAFALAFHYVKPAPPKRIVLATAQDEGGFKYYARKYGDFLKRNGIELVTRETRGSGENVALLSDEGSGVDVAFVQGGTPAGDKVQQLVSLGGLSYVPLWVFYRGEPIDDVRGLRGRRIAVGAVDSGTRALAVELLKLNGVADAPTQLLPLGRKEGSEQLLAGTVDALFTVAPAESPAIKKLAAAPDVKVLSFARAEAYARRLPYLTRLVLPRGVFDFAADVPAQDLQLVAPTANLVARESLHPALAYLLMRAATEVHGSAGLLDRAGEFPAALESGFALSGEARRYYKSGAPLLQRYLPFWAANLVDRLWVMLVPVIAVVVPLVRLVPPLYRWRVRSRIYRWYARLKELELELDRNLGADELARMLARLEEVDRAVNQIPLPLSYSENVYALRQHLDLVRRRINRRLEGQAPAANEAA